MVSFKTINCEGELRNWEFNSAENLLKKYWTDGFDLPSNDDEIFNGNFVIDDETISVKIFENIITELSVIYWNKIDA